MESPTIRRSCKLDGSPNPKLYWSMESVRNAFESETNSPSHLVGGSCTAEHFEYDKVRWKSSYLYNLRWQKLKQKS